MDRVLVGISGGIDSASTVLMLQERGYLVEGLYIDMLGDEGAIEAVEYLSKRLAIELHIANVSQMFEEVVIKEVLRVHKSGGTPSPCTICNPRLKWQLLKEYADRLGIEKLATGHYIRIKRLGAQYYIERGVDPIKDQSYYIYALGQDILQRAITPLGDWTKREVRDYLDSKGFEVLARGGESQGVCFAKRGYNQFVAERLGAKGGSVVDCGGNVVGSHNGYMLYTIGQKRGFNYFDGVDYAGWEVSAVDAGRNEIVVGQPKYSSEVLLEDWWFEMPEGCDRRDLRVNVRGLGRNPDCEIEVEVLGDLLRVELDGESKERMWAVTSGQPAVLYLGDIVVGGGIVR